ncbi:aspartyl/glutamyl-tRNA(Asn/Gln) amidotransferase subunit B [Chthoniobacter flavus]|uniref:Asp-tRNA(Asn)/Glu-tRNA(Gln) amidotransferase subunit GatB n=1 Tax=Chthoniobacter flavus TaxID=191863 RepID=UPI001050AB52|nr:Asp-tRNA(Asn)/Glu-tRNA(Gln) amidotransferase subunit GatB [Chthoniobacter flavus]TCO95768.1 aspartyl/glutamyl-tRNA(Asn/Gln) amidotransferase subunit B [Chthoniobacter flavus]
MPRYIPTIGLEVHVQLKTRSKMFCTCPVEYGAGPNSHTCPVCLGYPGALPVMNVDALKMSALTGLMLGCRVPDICKFDRKNYFYPDMPKNYQITQFDQPICLGGAVPLEDFDYPKDAQKSIVNPGKKVQLTRIHLEEDVAKSQHFEQNSGIDFNRAGTPLMEIVSEPEIDSPEEAFAYLTSLQQILVYGGVSDADMEKGQLRCDCNVSVRPEGTSELGTKIEIKNMNSISAVRRALAYEIERQIEAVQKGEQLIQSTRRWDDDAGRTFQMRVKESSHDYRYFPDPDLLPVDTRVFMDEVRTKRPELPGEKRDRFVRDFGVTAYDASVLASERALADYFDAAAKSARKPKNVANWIINDLLSALAAAEKTIVDCPISAHSLDELVNLIDEGKINSKQGKEVFAEMFATGQTAGAIVKEKGLEQVSDTGAIEALCDQAIAASAKAVAEYKAGKAQAINSIKGQVMKLSQGKANPQLVGEILARKLAE